MAYWQELDGRPHYLRAVHSEMVSSSSTSKFLPSSNDNRQNVTTLPWDFLFNCFMPASSYGYMGGP